VSDLDALAERLEAVSALYAQRCDIRRDDDWFALKLQEELGELIAEHLRLTGRGRQKGDAPEIARRKREDEAADLLGQLLLFCRHFGIDLDAAMERKWFVHLAKPPGTDAA